MHIKHIRHYLPPSLTDSDLVTGVELQLVLPFYLASRVFQGLERSVLRCKNAMFLLEWREEQL